MKKCPKCAELVQPDAKVCKHCGFQFPDNASLFRNIAVAAGAIFFVWYCSTLDPTTDPGDVDRPVSLVDASTRAGCAKAIEDGTKQGIVRKRPSADRVDVEDATWRLMAADDKRALLALVACDAFGKRAGDLDLSEHVVAYGYRSGKRLAIMTSVGVQFE